MDRQCLREHDHYFYPAPDFINKAQIKDTETYQRLYQESIANPAAFWEEQASAFFWQKKWDQALHAEPGLQADSQRLIWFKGALTNLSYNCLDRHLPHKAQDIALIWESDRADEFVTLTYQQLHEKVAAAAHALTRLGIEAGDRVSIYLPMIPELIIAMLACARIGAAHHVVYVGYSARSLWQRLMDVSPKMLITADGTIRAGKAVPLKHMADKALKMAGKRGLEIPLRLVVRRLDPEQIHVNLPDRQDHWWHEVMDGGQQADPSWLPADWPLFILHTPDSAEEPKGIVHSLGGYMVQVGLSHRLVFDHQPGQVHWCLNDLGFISGHSYLLYGPLLNGQTTVLYEGVPTFPQPDRLWLMVERWKITSLYTSPAQLRSLMRYGDEPVKAHDLSSLRILASTGEALDQELWRWYAQTAGHNCCPVVDTWLQTETGGIALSTLPAAMPAAPGKTGPPFLGMEFITLSQAGQPICQADQSGALALKPNAPGFMSGIINDQGAIDNLNWPPDSYYLTGDLARRDGHGYYEIIGAARQVMRVNQACFSALDVEEVLRSHPAVAKVAVVSYAHRQKGEGVYAFIVVWAGHKLGDALKRELKELVAQKLTPDAAPDIIQWVSALPQTRSGQILRRTLKSIAAQQTDLLNEIASLSDLEILRELLQEQ